MSNLQLIEHKMNVVFFDRYGRPIKEKQADCADANQSRAIGREIAQWMASGVGYRVTSETITCVRK